MSKTWYETGLGPVLEVTGLPRARSRSLGSLQKCGGTMLNAQLVQKTCEISDAWLAVKRGSTVSTVEGRMALAIATRTYI
jgi:hypothetical protein